MTIPLETQLIMALVDEDQDEAHRIAALLQARGVDMTLIASLIEDHPDQETALYAVLNDVIPLSRRAAKRRAIRAAEERDWGDWHDGRRQS